jgi:damage-control phosphatase, subfamily I
MKLRPGCYECLSRLVHRTAELASDDASLARQTIEQAMRVLEGEFSYAQLSIAVATRIHEVVRKVTRNPDPYRLMKEEEMALARDLYTELSSRNRDSFQGYIKLATAANAIDFFRSPASIRKDMREPVRFVIDDSEQFEAKLRRAGNVLYLADNAGELYFDLPLVKWMKRFSRVVYAVKPSPVQNDLTLEDVRASGLEGEFGQVMSTGVASPGVIFSLASVQFKREFESADLILAKGMGHYEALSELPAEGKIFYCLKAKCRPVADSLGVPLNSYVAALQ